MSCPCLLGEIQGREAGADMIGASEYLIILAANSPVLAFWIAVIIFAAVMLRRGGGRAERFLVTGAALKLVGNLLSIATFAITPWLIDMGYSMNNAVSLVEYYGIFLNVIGMAGIICLIYAFWVKFKARNFERKVSLPQY